MTGRVALGLGANIGDALGTLRAAVEAIAATDGFANVQVSAVYVTKPVGGVDQPDFLNVVVVADTQLSPDELIDCVLALELEHGRTREVRWGPRTLDIDVLALGEVMSDDPRIVIPHPRAHERAFVLAPWADIDALAVIPGHGTVAQCLAALPAVDLAGVRRSDDAAWGEQR